MLSATRARPRRMTIAQEEERAWLGFYRRVGKDASIAAEVMAQLEADPEMKREHLALYLNCRESIRLHLEREQRNQRVGQLLRYLAGSLFVELPKALSRKLKRGGDIALACLPEADAEPAHQQVRRLAGDREVAAARTSYAATAGARAAE